MPPPPLRGNARPRPWRAAACALLAAGCGGGAPSELEASDTARGADVADARCPEAPTYEACGGPLDGTWRVDRACGRNLVHVDQLHGGFALECWLPAQVAAEADGALTYAHGRERASLSIRTHARFAIPDACAAALEPSLAPAAFCERFAARLAGGARTGGCVYGPGGCACEFSSARALRHDLPYERVAGVLAEFPAEPEAGFGYCVDGDRLVQSRDGVLLHLVRR